MAVSFLTRLINSLVVVYFLEFFYRLYVIVLAILFTLFIVPVFILVLVPIYLFRYYLSYARCIFRRDLGKIMCTRSAVCSIDDLFSLPKNTLLCVVTVENKVDIGFVQKQMTKRVILAKDNKGKQLYPEFQQYYEKWWGFPFWKWDKDFKIENHVKLFKKPDRETPIVSELDLIQLRMKLVASPYVKNRSPWELIIVENYQTTNNENETQIQNATDKSVFILRIHHGLADGYSILKLGINSIFPPESKIECCAKPNYIERNPFRLALQWSKMILLTPYYIVKHRIECQDNNIFHPPENQLTRKYVVAAEKVPITRIKNICTHYGVNFSVVLLAAVCGGIRHFMINNDMNLSGTMHVIVPLPAPVHPSKLRNFWTFCVVRLPLEENCADKRLKILQKNWQYIKNSTIPLMNFTFVPFVGALPSRFIKPFAKQRFSTIIMSNFPGPTDEERHEFFGYPVINASFGGGLGRGSLGCGMALLSFNGVLQINMGIDQGILPSQKKMLELMDYIKKEIDILAQDTIV